MLSSQEWTPPFTFRSPASLHLPSLESKFNARFGACPSFLRTAMSTSNDIDIEHGSTGHARQSIWQVIVYFSAALGHTRDLRNLRDSIESPSATHLDVVTSFQSIFREFDNILNSHVQTIEWLAFKHFSLHRLGWPALFALLEIVALTVML